jgi:hypothetical protein
MDKDVREGGVNPNRTLAELPNARGDHEPRALRFLPFRRYASQPPHARFRRIDVGKQFG